MPGTKKKAYAQALPHQLTRLVGAWRCDILSTAIAICLTRLLVNMVRTLCSADSMRMVAMSGLLVPPVVD